MRHTAPLALLLATLAPAQDRAPSNREAEKLIAEFLGQDARSKDGVAKQQEILAKLRWMPELRDARAAEDWKKKIAKLWKQGRTLERSGDNWFFGDEKKKEPRRGRYIVGGGEQKKPKGLLIAMHGGGAGSGDAGDAFGGYSPAASKYDWVVVAPEVLEKTEHGWTDSGTEEFVLDLVDAALRTWPIDPDHVYFAGHSMGGYGSWTLGAHHADRLAAIAPSAGAPTPLLERGEEGPKITGIIEGVIPNLRNVFVSVYQSTDDPQVPPEPNQFAVKQLLAAKEKWGGFEHDYWELDGFGHAAPPGGHLAQLDRICKRLRDPVPSRVVWQPTLLWKRRFDWLAWDEPKLNAIVVADLDKAANAVHVTCDKSTKGLWVLLDERMLDLAKEVVVTVNDAEVFRGKVLRTLADLLATSEHPDGSLQFAARAPAFKPD